MHYCFPFTATLLLPTQTFILLEQISYLCVPSNVRVRLCTNQHYLPEEVEGDV
ncbi:uncharacterized protein DS421_8g243450 [Arachis hypogaea]|nr:uncharacterized protein DS421_8g243450 [Arachis hypogaea]